jgi:hypothetical protein
MPRFKLIALAFTLCAFAQLASAQDDTKKAAAAAQNKLGELQKQLAAGTDIQKRLRLDKFEPGDGVVKIVGAYIDTPPAKADDPVPFEQVTDELVKSLRDKLKMPALKFDTKGIVRIPPEQHPHVLVQLAANEAGAKGDPGADQAVYTDSQFNASGGLSIVGFRTKSGNAFGWMGREVKSVLDKHPAYTRPNGTGSLAYNLKTIDWKVGPADLQKFLATAGKPGGTEDERNRLALRRLFVVRAYFTYQVAKDAASLRFRIEGVRIGEGEVKDEWAQDAIGPLAAEVAGRPVPGDYGPLVKTAIEEPVKPLHAAVAARPALDGVRIDPGFAFGPEGELLPAGIQPGLSAEGQKELQSVVQSALAEHGKGKPLAAKYAAVAKRPVAVGRMTVLPLGRVLADLRSWVIRSKDDLKLLRLYFPDDLAPLKRRYFVEEGGLVLLYRPSNAADIPEVEAEFRRLLKTHVEGGIPQPPGGGAAAPALGAAQPEKPPADKEPLLPGLTAFLRREMAGDQKKWNGVLIERGYFNVANQYTILGVVDAARQNEELAKLLDSLKGDPKWAEYFSPPPVKPALDVIPMAELLDRVRRVTPAYPAFDGVRIESARYDADVNLIFDAHVVGTLDRDAAPTLEKLLRESPKYGRRAPAGKRVVIGKLTGTPYRDDQLADFSLAYGGKLMAKAATSNADRDRAKEWLDLATLHFPNESGVWFLSAYYNLAILKDDELTKRDLHRVINIEGVVEFNGPPQRKRRYEAAKDLQGRTRDKLETLWLDYFREAKNGAAPIALERK